MTVYFVRHAKAGSRRDWSGPDHERPLSRRGRRQADAISDTLVHESISRLVSSPYARCVGTLAPLGERLHLPVEESDALAEGSGRDAALRLVLCAATSIVLCSHGDVMGDVLWHLERSGVDLPDEVRLEKASTWALDVEHGEVVKARYLPPPV